MVYVVFKFKVTFHASSESHTQGCADVVISGVKHNLGAIGGGAVVLGLFQVSHVHQICSMLLKNKSLICDVTSYRLLEL